MKQTAVYLPAEMLEWLKAQGNVSETIREMIEKEMTEMDAIKRKLENPWSHTTSDEMSWKEIKAWAEEHVHPSDRVKWLRAAWKAFRANDEVTLGNMIIGS